MLGAGTRSSLPPLFFTSTVFYSPRLSSLLGLLGFLAIGSSRAQSGPSAQLLTAEPVSGSSAEPAAAAQFDSVYVNPEVRPQFVGGDKVFAAYLSKSIRYPQQALQRCVSGRVFVNFTLSAQGKVQDAHVASGPGSGLNDEALRLVWLMPAWEPARANGQPVRVACTVPISFNTER
ncbi:energy transducer TonB [Hymenobacter sp.]|uniref:energy transducer TonB n=1 Tax=Hymenobacter sp. TaxID=1898978 RepID=UPI00286CC88B|nr:energy transducer TonB [Hymenobacter sp.]